MDNGGIHPREFIIPWCDTYNIPLSVARRLWVEGFQDGDTVETITLEDVADFNINDKDRAAIMKAVNSYKKNRANVDSCILLIKSSMTGEDGIVYKKDKRQELKKNKPNKAINPEVESIINSTKKETPHQRKELLRRLHNKKRQQNNLTLAERIARQRNELIRNGFDGTISAPPLDITGRPMSMSSVHTTPPVFTDREGYHTSMVDEFGNQYPDSARFGGSMHDSGISEEDLDGLLKDAERLKQEEEGFYQVNDEHNFTPEDEALMDSIAEKGPETNGEFSQEPAEQEQAGEQELERAYTPDERALMESIQEDADEETEKEDNQRDSGLGETDIPLADQISS